MVRHLAENLYKEYQENLPYADPRTRNWLLLNNSPLYVWILTAFYLAFIYFGTLYMKRRPPFGLQWFLILYNFGLVSLSLYMVIEMILSSWEAGYNYICHPYNAETRQNPKELRVAKVLWWYFFSKAVEYMDTVLMVLRKKNSQVTFLHVFHHVSMLNIWWWVMMFTPGGQSISGPWMNCVVHVVMYSYYFLSCFPSLRKSLWWKRYLTKLQLVQFVLIFCHSFNTYLSGCDFPLWASHLLSGYCVVLIMLFSNFYIQSYLKKKNIVYAKKRDD